MQALRLKGLEAEEEGRRKAFEAEEARQQRKRDREEELETARHRQQMAKLAKPGDSAASYVDSAQPTPSTDSAQPAESDPPPKKTKKVLTEVLTEENLLERLEGAYDASFWSNGATQFGQTVPLSLDKRRHSGWTNATALPPFDGHWKRGMENDRAKPATRSPIPLSKAVQGDTDIDSDDDSVGIAGWSPPWKTVDSEACREAY